MINLTIEEKDELKTIYQKLSNLQKERAKLEVLKKDREQLLKEDIASVLQIKDKKGEIQSSRVKMPLVNAILDGAFRDKQNKKEEEIGIYEEYKEVIENKEVSEDCIKAYISTNESIEENISLFKDVYKESSILSKEVLNALNALLKEEYKEMLQDELNQNGYEIKEEKDNREQLELQAEIKELLKGE